MPLNAASFYPLFYRDNSYYSSKKCQNNNRRLKHMPCSLFLMGCVYQVHLLYMYIYKPRVIVRDEIDQPMSCLGITSTVNVYCKNSTFLGGQVNINRAKQDQTAL